MKKILLVVTFLAATCQLMIAQGQAVSGKITDETGTGLPGANIVVKGTTNGAISDADGQFNLTGVSPESVLQISSIGYTTQEVTVGTQTSINVQMVLDVVQLSEVVVVGYGNQERSMVTSAVSSVKGENLKDLPVTSVDQKLQGQLPGVQINQASGAPGGGAVIRIRGAGSLSTQNGANDPLYVVDGFPITNTFDRVQNPLATLNPDDIESVTVLKDAASTAIYGSRGANGVILINTKRAKAGQSSIEVNSSVGMSVLPDDRLLKMMNGQEYAQFATELAQDQIAFNAANISRLPVGTPTVYDPAMIHPAYRDPAKVGAGTDWFSMVTRKQAMITNHNVTITKGTDNVRALVSVGYFNQEGNVKTTGIERYSLRTNIDANVSKKVTIGIGLSPTYTVRKGPTVDGAAFGPRSLVGQAYYSSPVESPYLGTWDQNGNYTLDPSGAYQNILMPYNPSYTATLASPLSVYGVNGPGVVNPIVVAENVKYRTHNVRTLANLFAAWQIIPGLTAKTTFNADLRFDRDDQFNPANTNILYNPTATTFPNGLNSGVYNNSFAYNLLNENTIDYSKSWDQHKLTVLAGYSVQREKSNSININGSQYANDEISTLNNAGTVVSNNGAGGTGINEWRLLSQFARLTYSFGDRYVVSGTVRRDGSSRFGSLNRWASFPSVSAAWIASNESFFPQNNVLTEAKLRVSYGLSGSNAVGNYLQYANISLGNYYNFNGTAAPAAWVNNLGNPELTWEESKQTDIGLDLQFFGGRISLVTEVYNRLTTHMLQPLNVLWSSGFTQANLNAGEIQNRGLEIALSSRNTVNAIKWTTDFNISMNRNKVLDLGGTLAFYSAGGNNSSPNLIAEGQPLGMFTHNIIDGFITQEEYNTFSPTLTGGVPNPDYIAPGSPGYVPRAPGAVVGSWKYRDIGTNGDVPGTNSGPDGLITSIADRAIYKSPYPKFTLGFTNSVRYKNFDLSVLLTASYGNTIFTQYKFHTTNLDGSWNIEKEVANRYRQTNPSESSNALYATTIAGSTGTTRDQWYVDPYFFDGSFLNFKNMTLGYNVKLKGTNLRLYVSGQNVLIITKYPGGNPEVSQQGNSAREPGRDLIGYPLAATYTFGANFKF